MGFSPSIPEPPPEPEPATPVDASVVHGRETRRRKRAIASRFRGLDRSPLQSAALAGTTRTDLLGGGG